MSRVWMGVGVVGVLLLSVGCSSRATLNAPGLLTEPTTGSTLKLADGKAELVYLQDFKLVASGTYENQPTGSGTVEVVLDLGDLEVGDLKIPLGDKIPLSSKGTLTQEGGHAGLVFEPLKLKLKRELSTEAVAQLQPLCGSRQQIWLNATWSSTAFRDAPEHLTIEAGRGKIANLLTQQEVTVACTGVPAPAPVEEPATGG